MRIDKKEIIGRRISAFRFREGLTQNQLAELVNLSNTEISNLECGKNSLSYPTLVGLCEALDVCPCQLMTGAIKEKVEDNIIDIVRELDAKERDTLYLLLLAYYHNKNI